MSVFSVFLVILLLAAFVGVATARRPLARRGYWLRMVSALALNLVFFLALGAWTDRLAATAADNGVDFILTVGVSAILLALATLTLVFRWAARRLIDAGRPRWWALLGLAPPFLLVFGLPPSRGPVSTEAAVDVFR